MYEVYEEDYDESEFEYDYDGENPDEKDDYFAETENGDGDEDDDRPKKEKEKDEEVRVDPYRFLRKACPVEKATIPGCNMNDTMQRHIENYLAERKETSLNDFLSVSEPLINLEVSAFEVRYHVKGCFEDLKSAYLNGMMKALQKYDEAINYLKTVNPKPADYEELLKRRRDAKAELDRVYNEHYGNAQQAHGTQNWSQEKYELQVILELVPDRNDDRNKEAFRKLLEVEAQMKTRR